MLSLKKRIEGLHNTVENPAVKEACQAALAMFNGSIAPSSPFSQTSIIEESIVNTLIESLNDVNDRVVRDFVSVEKRIMGMNNIGVRNAIKAVMEDEIAKHPSVHYIIEGLRRLQDIPEWVAAETVIETLKQFDFSPVVQKHIKLMKENFAKYTEDIKIYKAVAEAKNTKGGYLMSSLEKHVENYLTRRTATNRAVLLETLSKYTFDPSIKNLYNTVADSVSGFQMRADSKDAYFKNVYSPVTVNEGIEMFVVHGKAYTKTGSDIQPLTETEKEYLPVDFMWLAEFINQSNVEISENNVKIFSRDKKVEIFEENGSPSVRINGRVVKASDFEKVYLNAGIFNMQEKEVLNAVYKITENWDMIMELDFAKSIFSHTNPNRRVDIFRCGEKIHMNKVDAMMNENVFYADCNGTQSRNLVLEFMNYDLGYTFKDLLSEEEQKISENATKTKEILEAIAYLETRKEKIQSINDPAIRESEEMKEISEAIDEEINMLKKSYQKLQTSLKKFTTVSEGFAVNDEVEYLKKKQG